MIKVISATFVLCLLITVDAYAGSALNVSGWVNIQEFCYEETFFQNDEDMCIDLLTKYQQATREHFKSLSADELRKISDRISRLADEDSERAKNLREAVDNIGKTLRNRIEIPSGVRQMPTQQYIQQQIQ